jgi:hypothetical protein
VSAHPPQGDAGWIARLADLHDRTRPDGAPARLARIWDELSALQLPGPGWTRIIDDLHQRLVDCDPGYRLLQVKEKFGGLRFYAEFDPAVMERCRALVRGAEAQAARTCERCGQPGRRRTDRRWILTLCDQCNATEPEGRPAPADW